MASSPRSPDGYHTCTCGESFASTDALLEHAREAHGIAVY